MARLIGSAQRIIHALQRHNGTPYVHSRNATSAFLFPSRPYAADAITKSHFEANIIRILRNEIDYQTEYAPPYQPITKFNSFAVEDRPGEQFIAMNGKFGDGEDIKIKVSMFDGFMNVPKFGEDSTGEDLRLHISMIVDISKENCSDVLEFMCSAWPDSLEIQQIFLLGRDNKLARPYMGPPFRNLSGELRKMFREYLETRGQLVNVMKI
ncbi:putative Mitochondrial glycoprotein family protein [Melia azedarach]|uniref:Mitochondrial glycoprotein family protein n=1 Tax=Melia azedarach TaxID=155640 RepID=A0ACC1X8X7_MELAZ|nr:putative Mitochondrial glycoprotein family protein [Melia azedarach]